MVQVFDGWVRARFLLDMEQSLRSRCHCVGIGFLLRDVVYCFMAPIDAFSCARSFRVDGLDDCWRVTFLSLFRFSSFGQPPALSRSAKVMPMFRRRFQPRLSQIRLIFRQHCVFISRRRCLLKYFSFLSFLSEIYKVSSLHASFFGSGVLKCLQWQPLLCLYVIKFTGQMAAAVSPRSAIYFPRPALLLFAGNAFAFRLFTIISLLSSDIASPLCSSKSFPSPRVLMFEADMCYYHMPFLHWFFFLSHYVQKVLYFSFLLPFFWIASPLILPLIFAWRFRPLCFFFCVLVLTASLLDMAEMSWCRQFERRAFLSTW